MLLGLSRSGGYEFVFLVGIPTMFAASAYTFLELARDGQLGSENWTEVGVAFLAAAVTGFVVVKWLMGYIKSHRFGLRPLPHRAGRGAAAVVPSGS